MIKLLMIDKETGIYIFIADTKSDVGATDQDIITDAGLTTETSLPMGSIILTTSFEKAMIDSEGNVVWEA